MKNLYICSIKVLIHGFSRLEMVCGFAAAPILISGVLLYCGVMKSWQTCPLVSGVKVTGQTMCSAGFAKSGIDRG